MVSHSSVGKARAEAEAGRAVVGVVARDAAIDQQAAQRDDEGLQLSRVISKPWTEPDARAPSASDRSASASGQATPWLTIRSTKSTPSSAIIEPTDSSMPPVMMTKACADREEAEQADQVGRVGEVDRREEARVDDGDDGADHQDQDEQAEVFLHACHASPR